MKVQPSPCPARDSARTRSRILDEARSAFARHGYDGTTVRAVARAAGVAPNLVTRYFGGKQGLYAAATATQLDVASVLAGEPSRLGPRIAGHVVRRWETATPEDPLLMMMRSASTSDEAARALSRFFDEEALRPTATHLADQLGWPPPAAMDRVASVGALICGVVTMRYVMRSGPLAAADPQSLECWLGERLQKLLDDPPPPRLDATAAACRPGSS